MVTVLVMTFTVLNYIMNEPIMLIYCWEFTRKIDKNNVNTMICHRHIVISF